jgi:MarR family transcriptional regulator, organic hydroperoxide resistance regulator
LWVIKLLEESSPMKAADLARRMYLHPATMVGLLDRLEAKQLIKRTRSSVDRRVFHIELTDQGRAVVGNSPEVVQSLLVKGLEKHTVPKLANITEELSEITKILGIQEMPPRLIMSTETNLPRKRKKS